MKSDIIKIQQSSKNFAFLYDAKKTSYSTGNSYIAYNLSDEISETKFSEFSKKIKKGKKYIGYFAYDIKNQFEKLEKEKSFHIKNYPPIWFGSFKNIEKITPEKILNGFESEQLKVKNLKSQFTKKQYIQNIEKIRGKIKNGEVYQVNLTNKFYGEFETKPDFFKLFLKLITLNPVPFAAYIKIGNLHIISASPELFIRIDKNKNLITCPIKGTAKNNKILESAKEEAENLMITDLMRNDLSRVCKSNSVRVSELFNKEQFKNYNHLFSTISGKISEDKNIFNVISNIFPAGSMTGAPKVAAMNIISELENYKRGIYSGILGHFEVDGEAEFSVIIRTLICKGNKFEFQVGGGITYDSNSEAEYEEILTKAKPIFEALGVNGKMVKKLEKY